MPRLQRPTLFSSYMKLSTVGHSVFRRTTTLDRPPRRSAIHSALRTVSVTACPGVACCPRKAPPCQAATKCDTCCPNPVETVQFLSKVRVCHRMYLDRSLASTPHRIPDARFDFPRLRSSGPCLGARTLRILRLGAHSS